MSENPSPTTHPGAPWLWITAWSFQGAGILAADRIVPEPGFLRLAVTGLIAAVPLAALYVYLLRRRGAAR